MHLLKLIVYDLLNNKNKSIEGKLDITKKALSMNLGTTRKQDRIQTICSALGISKNETISIIPYTINSINTPLTEDFLAGIIDGDGFFWVSFLKTGQIKPGFSITADTVSVPLLDEILKRFNGVGSIQKIKVTYSKYFVHAINQILKEIIPFMENNQIYSERLNHYQIFKQVCLILRKEKPLSLETKLKIVDMCSESNKKGKRRQLSKLEYIKFLYKLNS